jgi:hypothetical protein
MHATCEIDNDHRLGNIMEMVIVYYICDCRVCLLKTSSLKGNRQTDAHTINMKIKIVTPHAYY